jgi:cathepsin B
MQTTWTASVYPRHANATVASLKQRLGTILVGDHEYLAPEVERTEFANAAIPTSFDVRTAWPACSAITGRVRDQSNCGSCWAFSSTESFNDRFCIKTGDAKTVFSPLDTVSCCSGLQCAFSMGCNGGQPSGAWDWFTKHGVTSGADWADVGAGSTCKPYAMQSCAHHCTAPEGMVDCTEVESYKTPKCTSSCAEAAYGTEYSDDKHTASSSYGIRGVSNIQQDLMEKGSISVAFTVYEDFETYTSGIYQHKTGKSLGGHAVKLIGWGEENGTPYWTIMNSWNEAWGEKGTFRIIRGVDECGIESQAVAGDA